MGCPVHQEDKQLQGLVLGIGAHLRDEDARKISGLWGPDPVHPSEDSYKVLGASIEDDLT